MKTIKDILTENRESVISSIKYMFKIWKAEDVKVKMIEFLAYAEKYGDVEMLKNSKRVKTDLKDILGHLFIEQKREAERINNLRLYGMENPKLADVMSRNAEVHENRGEVWHPIYKAWVKDENLFSSMAKNPKFV